MGAPVIRVAGLSKRYRIGEVREPSGYLREALTDVLKAPFRRTARAGAPARSRPASRL